MKIGRSDLCLNYGRNMLDKLFKEKKLFWGYIFFAGIATVVDLGLLFALAEFLGISYLIAAALSYTCGMVTNYSLNKVFNFKNKSKKLVQQFGLFMFIALIGLGMNQLILWSLVEFAEFWYMSAKLVSISIVMLWSFYGHKKLTFGILK